jgi:hypothetical protein
MTGFEPAPQDWKSHMLATNTTSTFERVEGIEPSSSTWKADIISLSLPLYDTRICVSLHTCHPDLEFKPPTVIGYLGLTGGKWDSNPRPSTWQADALTS